MLIFALLEEKIAVIAITYSDYHFPLLLLTTTGLVWHTLSTGAEYFGVFALIGTITQLCTFIPAVNAIT